MKFINKYPFLFYGISVVILQKVIQVAIPNYGDTFIIKTLIEIDPVWRYLFYIPSEILWTLNGGHDLAGGVYISLILGFIVCLFLDFSISYYSKILKTVSQLKSGKNSGRWIRKPKKEISSIQSKRNRARFNPIVPITLFLFLNLIFTFLITPSADNSTIFWTFYSSIILSIVYYVVQIYRGKSFLEEPGFKVCNTCQKEDVIGVETCTCGGLFEPPEYYNFTKTNHNNAADGPGG